ncbi:MAG: hypothetical protein O3A47_01055, partial [Chloroflexi bacterium]|nr:hypothetical protein [Chloroflexota bacterium]
MASKRSVQDRLRRLELGCRNLDLALKGFASNRDRAALLHIATELRAQLYVHGQTPLLLQLADDLGVSLKVYGPKPGFLAALGQIVPLTMAAMPDSFGLTRDTGRP